MLLLRLFQLRMMISRGINGKRGSIPSLKCVRISSGKRNSVGMLLANCWSRGVITPACVVGLKDDSWQDGVQLQG